MIVRRFLLASSLARLSRRERGGAQILEGYFPDRPHRSASVRCGEERGSLIIRFEGDAEEATDIPLAQAEALLAVTAGQVAYVRTPLAVAGQAVYLDQVVRPGALDLIQVEFASAEEAQAFEPPPWFGPEVSADPAYQYRRLAFGSQPAPAEVELSEAALHGLLDLLEDRPVPWPLPHPSPTAEEPAPSQAPVADVVVEEEDEDLEIEDEVIRELAYSLRPRRPAP